jgi:hypothetical protein
VVFTQARAAMAAIAAVQQCSVQYAVPNSKSLSKQSWWGFFVMCTSSNAGMKQRYLKGFKHIFRELIGFEHVLLTPVTLCAM